MLRNFNRDSPSGYQQILAVTMDAGNVNLTVPVGAAFAFVTPEAQGCRYRDDGPVPSATVGMPIPAGTTVRLEGALSLYRFISSTAGCILNVIYYSPGL